MTMNISTKHLPISTYRCFSVVLIALCMLLPSLQVQAARTTTYLHSDGLGSVIAATDEQGKLLWRKHYAPYGQQIDNDVDDQALAYTGKPHDNDLGLSYFGARWYDPDVGRFTGIDPQGFTPENIQSFNRYAYANNNPYRYVDPNGESPLDIVFFAIDTVRFGAAVASGNPAAIASAGMDLAASTVGLISPIPGSGQVIKAGLAARKVAKAAKTFCFVKGTLIHTQHGLTPIEDIQVGDVVASKDELTGETRWKPVVQLFRNYDKPILNIRVVNVNGKVDVLGVTPEHPFWVEGFGWLEAGALQEGHELLDVSGQALRVESVAEDEKLHDTYNFEVKDYHTYFVGEQGAWVHNKCKVKKYDVSSYSDLRSGSKVGDGLDIHHAVQKHPAGQVVKGYDPNKGPAIALPAGEHRRIPTIKGKFNDSARDLLARDLRALRNHTNAPNSALQKLSRLNKKSNPGAFKK